ncbi:DUF3502 domain-containing protein [Paenibacillus antri]|uniref:DUF3502 domain-containing protein n=1 Tax=Paenibacillus antri TaxID=2582848 RepID=A0A5R9G3L6_9BACL|nr:DUF3502 domain-containing protein [Paenibacillus antri]TLS50952.1 DUF3502 domain-containing protein [Paenibacillus antri]
MARVKRGMGLAIVLAMLLATALAGCSNTNDGEATSESPSSPTSTDSATGESSASETPAAEPAIDTSKEVNLKGYLLGQAPKGLPDVMTELNTRLKKDINATLEVDYISFSELDAKYPLILTNNDGTDWIFSANWVNYVQHATKGAFMELTEEMIQKYMPRYYASIDKQGLEAAKINGKIYMLPAPARSPAIPIAVIRGDLRKKYGIPEIKHVSELGPYFEALKKNEPDMIPAALSSTNSDMQGLFYQMVQEQGQAQIQLINGTGAAYSLEDPTAKLLYFDEEPLKSKMLKSANTMKQWYDAGYINKNYFSNKTGSSTAFGQGTSGLGLSNTIAIRQTLDQAKANGWEVEIIPFVDAEGKVIASEWTGGGISLPAGAANPERTLMAMDLIISEQSYNYLVYFGIEGKHYVINADGRYELPAGVTPETNEYAPDAAGFWFTDLRQFPAYASWSEDYIALLKDIQENILFQSPLSGLSLNYETLKTEVASLTNARTQYFVPFMMGSVKNVDEAFNTFMEQARVAGLEKIKDEAQKQIDAFLQQKQ